MSLKRTECISLSPHLEYPPLPLTLTKQKSIQIHQCMLKKQNVVNEPGERNIFTQLSALHKVHEQNKVLHINRYVHIVNLTPFIDKQI